MLENRKELNSSLIYNPILEAIALTENVFIRALKNNDISLVNMSYIILMVFKQLSV